MRWRPIYLLGLFILYVIWLRWWVSSGFPLEGQICEVTDPPKNCDSYNVFIYSVWRLARTVDHWSALATAIATVAVAWFTVELSKVGRRQAKILEGQQNLQRAYIFGGCGPTWLLGNIVGQATVPALGPKGFPQIGFQPGYRNYGQTPAWVLDVVTVFCPEPLPERPNYQSGTRFIISDSARPDGENVPFSSPVVVEMTTPTLMYYGRFRYIDMLGNRRHSGFVYRLLDNGGHERIADAHPDYLDWN